MTAAVVALAMSLQTPQSSNNPIFPGWYADPEIHIFENRYYVYLNLAPHGLQTTIGSLDFPELSSV